MRKSCDVILQTEKSVNVEAAPQIFPASSNNSSAVTFEVGRQLSNCDKYDTCNTCDNCKICDVRCTVCGTAASTVILTMSTH